VAEYQTFFTMHGNSHKYGARMMAIIAYMAQMTVAKLIIHPFHWCHDIIMSSRAAKDICSDEVFKF
jgi:hypothetical protein